ncbi:EAL domain-containing protein [Leptothrix sp. BB-4]
MPATTPDPVVQGEPEAGARLHRPRLVGIGASAGGLEALKTLLPGLPVDADLTYVVLQHLAPTHRSLLAEILASHTTMPVHEVHDGDRPTGGVVLVTPPNAHIEFDGERLRLTEPDPQSLPRPSINLFFASLADRVGPHAVGVILSGTGSDGAMGLRQIHAAGGRTLVQQPATARYTGMPEAAIRAVGHDRVLPPEAIGPAIERRLLDCPDDGLMDESADTLAPGFIPDQFGELLGLVRRRCGIDFAEYKEATLLRRIARRMQARDTPELGDYLRLCQREPGELDLLARDTLISVTRFWRDPAAFQVLSEAIGALVRRQPPSEPLRVWVAGCATGEEAYSVAMAFGEALGDHLAERVLQIFATDLDLEALALARRGLYPPSALSDVPEALVKRYFTPYGAQVEFSRQLRERVVFSRHDLTRDPPFPRMDLICCRNVLIYLKQEAQSRVMRTFHYALQPRGLLFLGRSESVLHHEDQFVAIDKEQRLYERTGRRAALPERPLEPAGPPAAALRQRRGPMPETEAQLLRQAASAYLPPCVLLDERLCVLQVHGEVGPFLALRPGSQSLDVLSLARPSIESELRLMCALLDDSRQPRHADVVLTEGRRRDPWRMVLHPYVGPAGQRRALLAFERRPRPRRRAEGPVSGPDGLASQADTQADLATARERMKSLVEQLEASNEEMQALNEEAQATNEELQASNEELQSANEEMQATNQELATVNAELNHQWRRYQQLSDELQSIHNSIDLPLLVIDASLAIRRYNDAAARLFHLSAGCEGLQLGTMTRPAGMPDLSLPVMQALHSASPLVVHLPRTDDGSEFVLHLAHEVHGGERRGMVLTLVDNTQLARAERQTRSTEQRLLAVMSHGGALVAIKDASGRYEFANDRYCRFFELEPGTMAGRTDLQCLPAEVAGRLRDADIEVLREHEGIEREEFFDLDGRRRSWWVSRYAMRDEHGAVVAVCVQAVDLTRWHAADEELRIAARILDVTSEGVMITDPAHHILRVNKAFTTVTGYSAEEVRGKRPRLLSSGRHDDTFYDDMRQQLEREGAWRGEIWNKRKNGEVYPEWLSISAMHDPSGAVTHYVGVFSDISQLAASRERIERLATHDELTGLPNRSLLGDRLDHAIDAARRARHELALCFIDLDNFKTINDSLGHAAGDEMLRLAARRIVDHVRAADTVARIGGDEFVLLLEDTSRHECLQTVERLSRALAENVILRDSTVAAAASIGIAFFPSDGEDGATLMRNADAAMYRAKRAGRARYEFFSSEVGESARNRLQLESGLRTALQNGELMLVYQPQVQLADGHVTGFEALLRWRSGAGEWIAPSMFLPIAEETSLIDTIGDWVIDQACAQLAQWRQAGHASLTMSVNVSPRQLRDRHFADRVQNHLMHHRVPGHRLIIEVTESALLQPGEHLAPLLRRLQALEVQLSLDDFGTGYSSLAHLRQLPLHELKIDRSFIDGVADQRDDREIVTAILGLARALGLRVVAEGVETPAQRDALRAHAFATADANSPPLLTQGFLYAPGLMPDQVGPWLLRAARPAARRSGETPA